MLRLAALLLLLPLAPLPQIPGALPPPVLDIVYGSYDPNLVFDWYPPAETGGPKAAIVFIHGAGFPQGDKSLVATDEALLLKLLRLNGIGVASINYRPYPQFIYPAALLDCQLATQYLRANAASFGFDPQRLGVWGHSSGAVLAGWLAWDHDAANPNGSLVEQQSSRPALFLNDNAITDFALLVPWFVADFFGAPTIGQVDPALLAATSLNWELCNVPRPFTPPVYSLYPPEMHPPPLTEAHDGWFGKALHEAMRACTPDAARLSVYDVRDEPLLQIVARQVTWARERFELPGPGLFPAK